MKWIISLKDELVWTQSLKTESKILEQFTAKKLSGILKNYPFKNIFYYFVRFEGPAFTTVQELISHQYQSETPVTSRSGAILKTPVLRFH